MVGTIVLLLAVVFAIAGVSKFRSQPAFRAVLRNLVPQSLVNATAFLIPLAEIILAIALLNSATMRMALLGSVGLLGVFSVVLVAKPRNLKGCGCFGELQGEATILSGVFRNVLLISFALVALRASDLTVFQAGLANQIGQCTIVLGAICLWPCVVALANRRQFLLKWKPQS